MQVDPRQQRLAELRQQFIEAQRSYGTQSPQALAAGQVIARLMRLR
jgi:hypothetical protein